MGYRFALLLLAIAPVVAARTTITHEAIWLMKRVGAAKVSPDGKWVVFPVTSPAYDAAQQASDLWLAPSDGSEKPRRITSTRGAESGIAWSHDSTRLAFAAKREGDEASQIYVLDLKGPGEAKRVTSISTGAGDPLWHPDGKAILFTSQVYRGAADDEANKKIAAEIKARKYNARVYTSFPIRQWDHWLDERRPTLVIQPLEEGAKPRDLLAGTRLASEPGFGGKAGNAEDSMPAAWTRDGSAVVFAAKTDRNRSAYAFTTAQLYRASASGGEPVALTSENGTYDLPQFSADGKFLYAAFEPNTTNPYNLTRVVRWEWSGSGASGRRVLNADFDRNVDDYLLSGDGRSIFLLSEDAGHVKLYSSAAEGGAVKKVSDLKSGTYSGLSVAGTAAAPVLIAAWDSSINPAEVVRIDPSSGNRKPLTDFNTAAAAEIDWQEPRHFWFTSRKGKQIHSMLVLPPAFTESKKYPLLVLMHGGPHNMWRDQFFLRWNYHLLASPGYVVLLTDYTGSTGYGEKFAQAIMGDPLAGPAEEINQAADEAIRLFPFIDGARQAAAGASYGGHLANWMEASTTRYKCLISHAGLVNLESQWGTSDMIYHREVGSGGPVWEQGPVWREQNPARKAASFKTPMLVTVGERDFRVPLNNSIENWSLLQRQKVPSKLIVFPEENHWIQKGENSRFFYTQVFEWLKTWL
jgi:dipeptidyl aminopeptidase/acylaminoacyl peptidase